VPSRAINLWRERCQLNSLPRDQVLEPHRQFPYTNTGCLVYRVSDGCGAHSDRTNLAAELAACGTRKADFNTTQGDCSDTPQLCSCRPVGGLNAKACHDRREVTGEVGWLGFCRELALRLPLLQATLYDRFTAFSRTHIVKGSHPEVRL